MKTAIGPVSPVPPDHCPVCQKETGSEAVRRHLRWMHEADLSWDGIAKAWVVRYFSAQPAPRH